MTATLEAARLRTQDRGALSARWTLTMFSTEQLSELGLHVGPARRSWTLPKGLDKAKARRLGWYPGSLLREPVGDQLLDLGLEPIETIDLGLNVMCNAGITRMLNLLSAIGSTQAYDATHTSVAVGDGAGSVPTAAATDTDLAALTGSTHRYVQPVDATYPSVSGQVWTAQSTFTSANALFHWREFACDQTTAGGTAALTAPVLDHKGQDMGDFTGTSLSRVLKVQITES